MNRSGFFPLALALALSLAFSACGGGGSSGGEASDDLNDLVLIDVNVGGSDGVALNQIIRFEFSEEVVGSSVSPETIRIRLSPANAKQVAGDYNISGNIIEFFPRLPTQGDLSDAGLLPGSTYEIKLPGAPKPNTLENADGDSLADTYKVSFATAVASSPDLFLDYNPESPPHVVSVNPADQAVNVPQSFPLEITFSEPLHPATVTTSNIALTMVERPPGNPLDPVRPIQAHLILEQNRQSVVVTYQPDFPLADDAKYVLKVDRRVQDLAGNDSTSFESSFIIRDEPPVPGSFTLGFDNGTEQWEDTDVTIASWNRDVPGALAAIFTAGAGDGSDGDFEPAFNTTLNSDLDAELNFRVFKVPANVTVRLTGSKPITILSLAKMEIKGTVLASGSNGGLSETASYDTKVPANPGGKGGPGGGDGGDAATQAMPGTDGEDGFNTVGTGAEAPDWPSNYSTYRISLTGGSGGSHRTKGEAGIIGPYATYTPPTPGAPGDTAGNIYCSPLTGGGGGSPGTMCHQQSSNWQGAGSGGGGGGGVELRSANNIEIIGGEILAEGGDGGGPGTTYFSSPGGGGAGGAILIRSLKELIASNAVISVKGGAGHKSGFYTYYVGASGDGGDGWVRIEDNDGVPSLSQTSINPSVHTNGTFTAVGAGAPSVGQTLWLNMGVFDPIFLEPNADDVAAVIPRAGQTMKIEVQATGEDLFDLGNPDPDLASAWTDLANIQSLNGHGYSFVRIRVTFTLASDQTYEDPLPYLDSIRFRYLY